MATASRREFVVGVAGAVAGVGCHRGEQQQTVEASTPEAPPRASASAAPPPASAQSGASNSEHWVPHRRLGSTGVRVSMIGLGGFHIGRQKSESDSIQLIRRAIDAGITFLDNCWDYNDGQSELREGKALQNGYRQRVFLMTKLDGRTEEAATAQLEQSLKRLQTDVIDLVQIHEVIRDSDPRRSFDKGGVIYALQKAQKAGKLRFIGFTGHKDPKIHLAMLRTADEHGFRFDTVQMPLNAFDAHYRSFEREVLPVVVKKDIGVLGMKSMGDGTIVKSGVVTPEECLRYALSLPTSVVVSGIDTPEVLEQNLRIVTHFRALADDEKAAILAKTRKLAEDGKLETFKTTHDHDGTVQHPHWLEEARI